MSLGLNKGKLIDELTVIFTPDASEKAKSLTPKQVAEKMATAIENYVKSGKVKSTILPTSINTIGTPTAQKGPLKAVEISGKIE